MVICTLPAATSFAGTPKALRPTSARITTIISPIYMVLRSKTILRRPASISSNKGRGRSMRTAASWPEGYECKETAIENQCYQFRSSYSSPLNLNKSDPTDGSPDDGVEFKPITFNADKTIDCFDENCALTEPLAVTETQFDFNAVLRRTTMHEMGSCVFDGHYRHDHCDNEYIAFYRRV